MNAGLAIAAKQNRYVRRFRGAGATNAASARTLAELGCRRSFVFGRLVDRGIFVEVSGGRYYVDIERAYEFRSRRRTLALVIVGLVVVIVFALLWMR